MLFRRLNPASPEQIFMSVANASTAATMYPGYGVFYLYTGSQTTGTAASGSGYQVTFAGTNATFPPHPANFAGIVAGRAIQPGDNGSVQVWGHCPVVAVRGLTVATTTAPWTSIAVTTAAEVFQSTMLRPLGIFGQTSNEGAATNAGYLGLLNINFVSSVATYYKQLYPGGYVVPVDGMYAYTPTGTTQIGTALITLSHNSTGACKGFIRCL